MGRKLLLTWKEQRKSLRVTFSARRKMLLVSSANLMMNNLLLQRSKKLLKKFNLGLREWRKSLRLKDKDVPRLRGKDLICPANLKTSMSVLVRQVEQQLLKLSSIRRGRQK